MSGRLRELWQKILALFCKRTLDDEFNEEIASHVEMAVEENILAGMSREEARRKALLQLGGHAQACEVQRAARGMPGMESLIDDIRYALLSLRKSPGFALTVIGMLALGIGAVTAIVGAIDQTVLRKPFPNYERFAIFGTDYQNSGLLSLSYPVQILPFARQGKSFESLTINAYGRGSMNTGSETFGADYGYVNRSFFSAFDGRAVLGRLFRPDEFTNASSNVVVLRHQFWKEYFNSDPGVIGRTVVLGNRNCRIVGVLSKEFSPSGLMTGITNVFMPLDLAQDPLFYKKMVFESVVCLRQGVTPAQANKEVAVLCAAPDASPGFRERHKKRPLHLKSLSEYERGRGFSNLHGAFLGAVGFLFAIACMNAVDLMLVRLSQRRRELGIRSALGGSRCRMIRLIVMESLILNLIAGLSGFCVALVMKPLMLSVLTNSEALFDFSFGMNSRAHLIAAGASLLSAVIVSLVPVWRLRMDDPQHSLKESGIAYSENRSLRRLRGSLVVMNAAMAIVLLTGTGLMIRSVHQLMHVDRGFDPGNKIAFWLDLPKRQAAKERFALARRIEERLRGLPGIWNVATSNTVPLAGTSGGPMQGPDGQDIDVGKNPVSPGYFRGMGMKLLKGRWLPARPDGSPEVMLINASMARKWFGTEDPVGRTIKVGPQMQWEVIGVVSDVLDYGPGTEPRLQLYHPNWQDSGPSDVISLLLDLSVPPNATLTQMARKAIHDVDPDVGVRAPIELEKAALRQISRERFTLLVLGVISAIATLLAVLGMFSVMTYSVSCRLKDFGIRLALGSPIRLIYLSVLKRGLVLSFAGISIGLCGSWMLTRYIKSLLYETSPVDPMVYSATALLMFLAALSACWIPANKAASVDASHLLRME